MTRILLYFVRAYPWHTAVMVLCNVLASVAQGIGLVTVLPLLSIATGEVGERQSPLESAVRGALAAAGIEPTVGGLLVIIVIAFLAKAVLVLLAKNRVGYTVAHTATDLRLEALRALLATRWSYFTRYEVGAAANAIATEADRASQAYLHLAQMMALLTTAAAYAAVALGTSWQVTLAAAAAGGFSMLLMHALVTMSYKAGRRQTRLLKSLLARLTDSLQAVKVLKAMGREGLIGPLLEADTQRLNRQLKRRVFSREALTSLQEPVLVVCMAAYLYAAIELWGMTLSSVLLLAFLFASVLLNLNKVQRKYQLVRTEASALWSIRELIDGAHEAREQVGGEGTPTLERGIALEGVAVRYGDNPVLAELSLEIPAGQLTAIVGGSGAGKTTIVDLLTGLIQPSSGSVRIDGVPLEQIDLRRWRHMVGYVPQEMPMLHDTLRVNVTLGDPELSDADVERALRDAGAWEFVSRLPEGVDASMGERGSLFSGGQRQRVAIARALVHRPRLLILDEATAALDPESEAAVWSAVAKLRGKTTVVAISHQPALTSVADRIYRIENAVARRVAAEQRAASA